EAEEEEAEAGEEEAEAGEEEAKAGEEEAKAGEEEAKAEEEDAEAEKEEGEEKPERKEKEKKPIPASPSVRRLAREIGVKIEKVEGTGPGNRITTDDVKSYAKAASKGKKTSATATLELPDFSQWGETERQSMNRIRQITAESMITSWQNIPQVTQFDEADVTELEAFRQKHAKKVEKAGGKLTVTSMLVKICALALEKFPRFNASIDYDNKEIILKKYYNVGLAVDTPQGLLVPVVRDVDKKSMTDISVEVTEMAKKAREKKLGPDAMQGGNFTISNLGGIGGTNFTPIVYSPQVAILGLSRATQRVVSTDEGFEERTILPLSLTYDHRIIDGADGARFLRWIAEALENPLSIYL
ncbi:MAG: 2-oxo acid dehydrogenase subunit E2, partial [Bacteroidota bacterium]